MHDLYIAEIYRPGTIFMPRIVCMVLSAFTSASPGIAIYGKVVRFGRSRAFKITVLLVPIESPCGLLFYRFQI